MSATLSRNWLIHRMIAAAKSLVGVDEDDSADTAATQRKSAQP
jgi:hypothetical protein